MQEYCFVRSETHEPEAPVEALVVTPSNKDENVSLLNARSEVAKVTARSKAGGFTWILENLPEMSYLLVYGTTSASAVIIDDKVLPKAMTSDLDVMPIGWRTDRPVTGS